MPVEESRLLHAALMRRRLDDAAVQGGGGGGGGGGAEAEATTWGRIDVPLLPADVYVELPGAHHAVRVCLSLLCGRCECVCVLCACSVV